MAERVANKFARHFSKSPNIGLLNDGGEFACSGTETVAFVSRPPYLQRLPTGELFDRIVDPLIFASENRDDVAKYYTSPLPDRTLYYSAQCLGPTKWLDSPTIPQKTRIYLKRIASEANVDAARLAARYVSALRVFNRWYDASMSFLAGRDNLKRIYLVCWYFPDMMALTAAARTRGITVIDVQHGKQGKFQPMYSGWSQIPEEGYLMMPDRFWCWGQQSCDHILAASSDRKVHRPFVGGFLWPSLYKQLFLSAAVNQEVAGIPERKRRILVTTQPSRVGNIEPIPDFLIDYLQSDSTGLNHFVFRCHPNDSKGLAYCQYRLASISESLYSIDDGKGNLYDKLLQSTHHITEYSSCCYEADNFGVPTLLFGQDAKVIHSEEIESGMFSWTAGVVSELTDWLELELGTTDMRQRPRNSYLVSSLADASSILANNEI
jgi:hypothetical protein